MTDIEQREPVAWRWRGVDEWTLEGSKSIIDAVRAKVPDLIIEPLYTGQQLAEVEDRAAIAAFNRGLKAGNELSREQQKEILAITAEAERLRALVEEARLALVWFFDATDAELTRLAKKKARDLRDRLETKP